MHAHYFSRRRDLKPLGGAAMRLELELFYFFCHKRFLSEILLCRTGFTGCGKKRNTVILSAGLARRISLSPLF
jgi:hypothetical protein